MILYCPHAQYFLPFLFPFLYEDSSALSHWSSFPVGQCQTHAIHLAKIRFSARWLFSGNFSVVDCCSGILSLRIYPKQSTAVVLGHSQDPTTHSPWTGISQFLPTTQKIIQFSEGKEPKVSPLCSPCRSNIRIIS